VNKELEGMWKEAAVAQSVVQQGSFIDVFLARHVSGTYAHHQEH